VRRIHPLAEAKVADGEELSLRGHGRRTISELLLVPRLRPGMFAVEAS
jgi:hypothetical protein